MKRIIAWLGILCILAISIILLVPMKESFNSTVNNYRKYPITPSMDKLTAETNTLKANFGMGTELSNELLFMDRCIQFKPTNTTNIIPELDGLMNRMNFPYRKVAMNIKNINDLEKRILIEIEAFYIYNNLPQLYGPIYVLVLQAPYLRVLNSQCRLRMLSVQFNSDQYKEMGYYLGPSQSDEGWFNVSSCPSSNLLTETTHVVFYVLFPAYDKTNVRPLYFNWKNIECNMRNFLNHRSFHKNCFMKCKNSNHLVCGCLNLDKPYKSRCLDNDGALTDHGVLYLVNSQEASRRVKGVFNVSFFGEAGPIKPSGLINENYCTILRNKPPLPTL